MPTGVAAQTPTMTSASTAKRARSAEAARGALPTSSSGAETVDDDMNCVVRESLDDRARPRPAGRAPTPRRKAGRRAPDAAGRPASPRRRRRGRRGRARPRRSRCGGSVRSASPSRGAIDGRDVVGVDEHAAERGRELDRDLGAARRPAVRRPRRCAGSGERDSSASRERPTTRRRARSARIAATNARGPRSDSMTSSTPTATRMRPCRSAPRGRTRRAPRDPRVDIGDERVRQRGPAVARRRARRTTPRARPRARRRSAAPGRRRGR